MESKSKIQKYAETMIYTTIVAVLLVTAYGFIRDYPGYDDTDDVRNGVRSNMSLRTDYGTGCQYLVARGLFTRSITPRMNADGSQVCKEKDDGKRRKW